ncbi:MAG TPA: DUF362 domain-containing protein [Anaerolineae bacterium]
MSGAKQIPEDGRRPRRLSRRSFLGLSVLAGVGAGVAVAQAAAGPIDPLTSLGWAVRGETARLIGKPAQVALGQCASYGPETKDCLADLWRRAGMPDVAGKRVLVKPNLVDTIDGHPTTTAPEVIGAVLDVLRDLGVGEVVVGEGPAFRREAWPIVENCGLAAVLARRNVPFVDLNYDDPRPVPARDGWLRQSAEIWLPRHVREAQLIVSVPKLKTHHWATVSLSLKNLFGIVPGACYGWPKNMLHLNGVAYSILGLYQTIRPMVSVIDGIVGMEGDGPLFGRPVPHGLLAVGADPVAVDITCARAMGFGLEAVEYLRMAAWAGLGEGSHIEILGAPLERLQRHYEAPPSAA